MRACNCYNNNMRNLKLRDVRRGYACLNCCMPSSPVLLYIYLILGCTCYYFCMPSSRVAAYILPSFSTFWNCHPYTLQHFNGTFFSLVTINVVCHHPLSCCNIIIYTCFLIFGTAVPTL